MGAGLGRGRGRGWGRGRGRAHGAAEPGAGGGRARARNRPAEPPGADGLCNGAAAAGMRGCGMRDAEKDAGEMQDASGM